MVDSVLVTLVHNGREFDMEIPAKAKVSQIKPVIVEALSRKGSRPNGNPDLIGNGSPLQDSDTLLGAGVWDGSYLTVV
jgi:hypothetical protein